jgi:hypothetical protein
MIGNSKNFPLLLVCPSLKTPVYFRGARQRTQFFINLYKFGRNTGCPTRYRTRHFFNNSNTNKDIATKFEQGVRSLCEK